MAECQSGWQRALYKFRPQLEDRLKIDHHISSIHEAVPGGFLTNKEEQDIISQAPEYNRVRKLVEILATKDEKDFEAFAAFLKTNGLVQLAEEMGKEAKEDKAEDLSSNKGDASGDKPEDVCGNMGNAEGIEMCTSHTRSSCAGDSTVQKGTTFMESGNEERSKTEATDKMDTTPISAISVQKEALATLKKISHLSNKLLRILVVGEPGSGKSTLIHNIFGVDLKGRRGELREHSVAADGCPLVIYISYGLEDTDKHFKKVIDLVHNDTLSLIIYCLPIRGTRLHDRFYGTVQKHSGIGIKWDKCLLAFTFADEIKAPRHQRYLADFDMKTFFMMKMEDWAKDIKQRLLDEAIPSKSAFSFSAIRIHSTTEHSTVPLHNGRDWYGPLWADILDILMN